MTVTKVFISYSWSSPDHEDWVLRLATQLRECGVDAILDKWDLKVGQEANAFMEQMVADDQISKVLIVSDRLYCEKSDKRKGGAGTEAQIISREIFERKDQSKFVALVVEKDESGTAYVPVYYTSRIFIDFSDESRFSESFEQLLRWVADKPIYKKPEIGVLPSYIDEPDKAVVLATSAARRRALDGMTNAKPFAFAAVSEYFQVFVRELGRFRFAADFDPLADEVIRNFDSFNPYREEWIEVLNAICRYSDELKYSDLLHKFFENLFPYFKEPESFGRHYEYTFDNFKYFAHELFLHSGATLISEGRFEIFNVLVERQYYLKSRAERGVDPMRSFTEFRPYLKLLDHRNKALQLNRISLHADMLKQRVAGSGIDFVDLMQVDFILFLREALAQTGAYSNWWPETLVYVGYGDRTFEIFDRARSTKYFEKIRPLLGGATKKDLEVLLEKYNSNPSSLPRWDGSRVNPAILMAFEKLCTIP